MGQEIERRILERQQQQRAELIRERKLRTITNDLLQPSMQVRLTEPLFGIGSLSGNGRIDRGQLTVRLMVFDELRELVTGDRILVLMRSGLVEWQTVYRPATVEQRPYIRDIQTSTTAVIAPVVHIEAKDRQGTVRHWDIVKGHELEPVATREPIVKQLGNCDYGLR